MELLCSCASKCTPPDDGPRKDDCMCHECLDHRTWAAAQCLRFFLRESRPAQTFLLLTCTDLEQELSARAEASRRSADERGAAAEAAAAQLARAQGDLGRQGAELERARAEALRLEGRMKVNNLLSSRHI